MAFGNLITSGTQVSSGTNGFIVAFDLSGLDADTVFQVQLQKSGTTTYDPVTAQTPRVTLFGYTNVAIAPPNYAYCQDGQIVYVFCNTGTFAFDTTTRVAFWFYRNAQNVTLTTDKVDVPDDANQLAVGLILRKMYIDLNVTVPRQVIDAIRVQTKVLNVQYPI